MSVWKEVLEVFSRRYASDAEYARFLRSMREHIALRGDGGEGVDEKMGRLRESGYASDCHVAVGDFE